MTATQPLPDNIFTSDTLLAHWQVHRGLTRKTIKAFPDDKLFSYSVGGMRPFAELVSEFLGMTIPGVAGIASGKWEAWADAHVPTNKKELLELWDKATDELNRLWPTIPAHRWHEH